MGQSRRRAVLIGAVLAVACAAAAPVQAATPRAGTHHFGTWIQTGWNIDGQPLACPIDLQLPPPAPSISCSANTYLTLTRNGRYASNMPSFRNQSDKGAYDVVLLAGGKRDVIVFDDDGDEDAPRAYRVHVKQATANVPATLTIFMAVSMPGGAKSMVKMIFARKAS